MYARDLARAIPWLDRSSSPLGWTSSPRTLNRIGGKCVASRAAAEATTDAVQVAGGYGYMKDYPLQKMMRAAYLTQVLNGTIHAHELASLG